MIKSGQNSNADQIALADQIAQATTCLNEYWPLESFIALNALKGYEKVPFEDAIEIGRSLFGSEGHLKLSDYRAMYETGRINPEDLKEAFKYIKESPRLSQEEFIELTANSSWSSLLDGYCGTSLVNSINELVIKWLGAYFDKTQAQFQVKESGLFRTWHRLVVHEKSLDLTCQWRELFAALPGPQLTSLAALEFLLQKIGVGEDDVIPYMRSHLIALPGWSSYLLFCQNRQGAKELIVDYLAIRLFYEYCLASSWVNQSASRQGGFEKSFSRLNSLKKTDDIVVGGFSGVKDASDVWQEAYEINYRNRLLDQISGNFENRQEAQGPDVQMVFCIDVRSEPVRRHLEFLSTYETLGFAGFFGMPMRFKPLGGERSLDLCPALLSPDKAVSECCSHEKEAERYTSLKALGSAALLLRKKLKSFLATSFGLIEAFGVWSALPLSGKTLFPQGFTAAYAKLWQVVGGEPTTSLDLSAYTLDEKIATAYGALCGTGLAGREQLAPLVVLCGHGASSQNNPYASALDCGACGGNSGRHSARLAAAILNDEEVRAGLSKEKQISIAETTRFLACEHDTTKDTFRFFDLDNLKQFSAEQKEIFAKLQKDLELVGALVRKEREKRLPLSSLKGFNHPFARACDWAQNAPEWGLARNAAFVAAPRSLTRGLDLAGRTFLHSYDWKADESGKVLELIMTAPMVVAQWINSQYYFSTMDNRLLGSGSKVLHNVVGDFGVMQGLGGDLLLGLPRQSVMSGEEVLEHEPMRLLVLLAAPVPMIDKVLSAHPAVADLVNNRWIHLVSVGDDGSFQQALGVGRWIKIERKQVLEKVVIDKVVSEKVVNERVDAL